MHHKHSELPFQQWDSKTGMIYTGWWYAYPSEKYKFVSWEDYSQCMEKSSSHVPNHQPGNSLTSTVQPVGDSSPDPIPIVVVPGVPSQLEFAVFFGVLVA